MVLKSEGTGGPEEEEEVEALASLTDALTDCRWSRSSSVLSPTRLVNAEAGVATANPASSCGWYCPELMMKEESWMVPQGIGGMAAVPLRLDDPVHAGVIAEMQVVGVGLLQQREFVAGVPGHGVAIRIAGDEATIQIIGVVVCRLGFDVDAFRDLACIVRDVVQLVVPFVVGVR